MCWRLSVPNLLAYDPAFAYEIAVIIQDGIKRMYVDQESIFYYLTVTNELLPMPPMPEGKDVREGILKGMYRFKTSAKKDAKLRAQLFGSGTIMYEVLKAQQILEEKYSVAADVWSVTSYKQLYRDGNDCERWNMLHPGATPQVPFVTQQLERCAGRVRGGIGLHESTARIDFAVDAAPVGIAGNGRLRAQRKSRQPARLFRGRCEAHRAGHAECPGARGPDQADAVKKAMKDLGINPEKPNPAIS